MPSDTNGSSDPNVLKLVRGKNYEVDLSEVPDNVKIEAIRRAFGLPPATAENLYAGTMQPDDNAILIREACRQAFSHVLSNEVASWLGNQERKRRESDDPEYTPDELEQLRESRVNEHLESFADGSWGTTSRGPTGPRLSTFDAEFARIARANAKAATDAVLKKQADYKYNGKTKTWTWTAKGQAFSLTLDDAKDRWLSHPVHGESRKAQCEGQAREAIAIKEREAEMRKSAIVPDANVGATLEELNI